LSPLAVLRIIVAGTPASFEPGPPREVPPRDESIRAADRLSILRARSGHRRLSLFLLLAGPGILVMLGENDGPSMLSYATTGATFGIGFFLPFIVLTFFMAWVVQELTARLGIATGRGHAALIFERFGPLWGRFALADLAGGNLLTLVTEFIAITAGAAYFGVSPVVAVAATVAVVLLAFRTGHYRIWERLALGLALGNLIFIPAAFLAHPDGHAIGRAFATWGPLALHGRTTLFVTMVMANIGATVTPWMIFFQQSTVADKGLTRDDLGQARLDTALGAVLAATVAIATVVAAAPLYAHGIDASRLGSVVDFGHALAPYIGAPGASLFALGMIEAGLVAVMTISTSSAYAIGDVLQRSSSLNLRFRDGRWFYFAGIVSVATAAGVVLIPNAPLLAITITVNVIATLLMPPALLFLLLLINDPEVAGDLKNGRWANLAGGTIIVAISLVGAVYGFIVAFPQFSPR
jgi:Mn2+/Fe2+ NRAMP family transporter